MNYYEELGIRSDADEEEIRKAHRRLVKLMHPDQHRDAGMKQLAETQMRRLNSIVATLLDPEEREEYDEQLRGGDAVHQAAQQSTWRSVPWWIASTLGAIVLTVAAVWFFADRIGSGFHPPTPTNVEDLEKPNKPGVTAGEVPPVTPVAPAKLTPPEPDRVESGSSSVGGNAPDTTVARVAVPGPVAVEKPKPPVVVKQAEPFPPAPPQKEAVIPKVVIPTPKPAPVKPSVAVIPLPPPVKQVVKEVPAAVHTKLPPPATKPVIIASTPKTHAPTAITEAPARRIANIPVVTAQAPNNGTTLDASLRPPPIAGAPSPGDIPTRKGDFITPPPPPVASAGTGSRIRDPLEGEWVYAPTEPEKRKPGFYPPEFIQLKLKKDTSGMRGEYSARYNVDRAVSPDVNFVLKAVDNKALKYVWTAADGSHGWFVIRNLEPDTMRLEWRATSSRGGTTLSSGMATLVRKN